MTQDNAVVLDAFYREVDFKAFRERLRLSSGDLIKALELPYGTLQHMTHTGRVSALVWKRACLIWGGQGVKAGPTMPCQGRRYHLSASYADKEHPIMHRATETPRTAETNGNGHASHNGHNGHSNGNGNGHAPIPAPGPILFYPRAVAPDHVSWDVYASTVQLLLEQNALLLAEKLAVDTENIRLVRRVAFYENDADGMIAHSILDRIKPMRTPSAAMATALSIVSTSVKDKVSGLDACVQDLNARFPKTVGLSS